MFFHGKKKRDQHMASSSATNLKPSDFAERRRQIPLHVLLSSYFEEVEVEYNAMH
jgi:TRAP-type uncharacterized transport system substrate-binding protein